MIRLTSFLWLWLTLLFFPLVPSSYRVLRDTIYSFPLVRYSWSLSAGVLHALLCQGVFLMYPWREMYSTSTYSSTILFWILSFLSGKGLLGVLWSFSQTSQLKVYTFFFFLLPFELMLLTHFVAKGKGMASSACASYAWCTWRPNKPKHQSLEQRKDHTRRRGGLAPVHRPELSCNVQRRVFIGRIWEWGCSVCYFLLICWWWGNRAVL